MLRQIISFTKPVQTFSLKMVTFMTRAELGDRINIILRKREGSLLAHSELQRLKAGI